MGFVVFTRGKREGFPGVNHGAVGVTEDPVDSTRLGPRQELASVSI